MTMAKKRLNLIIKTNSLSLVRLFKFCFTCNKKLNKASGNKKKEVLTCKIYSGFFILKSSDYIAMQGYAFLIIKKNILKA